MTHSQNTVDLTSLQQYLGHTSESQEVLHAFPCRALAATLDRNTEVFDTASDIPALWHWLYFLPIAAGAELDQDGHAAASNFLPTRPLPLRMWAGSKFEFHHALRVGAVVTKKTRLAAIEAKQGDSGALVFVRLETGYEVEDVLMQTETLQIVYREPVAIKPALAAEVKPFHWHRLVKPDATLLFRYSALTFNSHRIHYDHPYATGQEGYPGLVVHGPLIATLLAGLVRDELPGAGLSHFECRARAPLFVNQSLHLYGWREGDQVNLWACAEDGHEIMVASARLR